MKKIEKRKVFVSTILALLITFLQVAGWQISMDYGSSVHSSTFFQNIGVLTTGQCILWGLLEWLILDILFYQLFLLLDKKATVDYKERPQIKYLWVFLFLFLLTIWYFILWCCYPGYNSYDVGNQLIQVMYKETPYNAHHPLLHTLFSGGLITLGYKINSVDLSFGIFLANVAQMFLLAICLTYSLRYIYNKSKSIVLTGISFIFYAFCPPIVMFAMLPTKDVPCYAVLLVAVIKLRELYKKLEEGKLPKKSEWILIGILLTISCLTRKNIIYAVVVFAIAALIMVRKEQIRQLALFLCILIAYFVIDKGLLLALDAIPGSVNEALCTPYQAMARLYVEKGASAFTEEEYVLLSEIVPPDALLCYDPIIADGVKANFNPGLGTLLDNKWDYVKLWVKKGIEYPEIFLEAIMYNTYQAWYPGTLIMDNDGGRYFEFSEWNDEYGSPNWQGLYDYYTTVGQGDYAKYPIIRLLFVPGTMFWVMLATWFWGVWRRDKTSILSLLLILLVCGTAFLGPVSDIRYYLILFYLAPVCLGIMLEKTVK